MSNFFQTSKGIQDIMSQGAQDTAAPQILLPSRIPKAISAKHKMISIASSNGASAQASGMLLFNLPSQGYLKPNSVSARVRHIIPYEQFVDTTKKVAGINNESIRDYMEHLNSKELSKETRKTYFSAFAQFLIFLEIETDFKRPKELTLGIQRFVSNESTADARLKKKELLWTPALFQKVLASLPEEKRLWILLCINCGFRNTDISHLRWKNIHGDRLHHQREKLNALETAPVINYRLWPETQKLLKKQQHKSELVFLNRFGEPYHKIIKIKGVEAQYDGIANWWQKNRINYDLPRLDFLRKTGASFVAKTKTSLTRMYLAETLTSVENISYVFNDGEIHDELDQLTDLLRDHMCSLKPG